MGLAATRSPSGCRLGVFRYPGGPGGPKPVYAVTATHLGQIVSEEAGLKRETDVTLSFEWLTGSDSQSRGRALKTMTDVGIPLADSLPEVDLE